MNNSVNLLIKPTHMCNLDCKYCYEKDSREYNRNKLLRVEAVDKLLHVFSKQYKNINIIWHGGEPLLASRDWFEKVYSIISKYQDNNIKCSMQSNGVLYEEYKDLIDKYKINYSVSYDYINNNKNRCNTSNIINHIGQNISTISVVDYVDVDNLISQYEYNKLHHINNSMNHIFINPNSDENDLIYYIEGWKEYLEHVFYDHNNLDEYEERMSINYFKTALGYKSVLCEHKECMLDFYCLDVDENIYHCDRFWKKEDVLCNLNDIEYVTDILNSDGFLKFKEKHLKFKKYCQEHCEIFSLCNGGCIANRINQQDCFEHNSLDCLFIKEILLYCFNLIKNINDINKLNPVIYKLLWKKGYIKLDDCKKIEFEGELW